MPTRIASRAALVEDFRVFQHAAEHGVGVWAVFDERFVGTDQEVGGEVGVVGDGAVDRVAAAGWFDDSDVSPTIQGPRLRAAWATGPGPCDSNLGSPDCDRASRQSSVSVDVYH